MKLLAAVCLMGLVLQADNMPSGTWVRRAIKEGRKVTMTIEVSGSGRRLTYTVELPDEKIRTLAVTTGMDGKETPVYVDGKVTPQTWAFNKSDDRHTDNIVKSNGTVVSTQKWEVATDGKTIKIETIPVEPRGRPVIDHWDKN